MCLCLHFTMVNLQRQKHMEQCLTDDDNNNVHTMNVYFRAMCAHVQKHLRSTLGPSTAS